MISTYLLSHIPVINVLQRILTLKNRDPSFRFTLGFQLILVLLTLAGICTHMYTDSTARYILEPGMPCRIHHAQVPWV